MLRPSVLTSFSSTCTPSYLSFLRLFVYRLHKQDIAVYTLNAKLPNVLFSVNPKSKDRSSLKNKHGAKKTNRTFFSMLAHMWCLTPGMICYRNCLGAV